MQRSSNHRKHQHAHYTPSCHSPGMPNRLVRKLQPLTKDEAKCLLKAVVESGSALYKPPELEAAVSKLIVTYGQSPQVGHMQCGLGWDLSHGTVWSGQAASRTEWRGGGGTCYMPCLKCIGARENVSVNGNIMSNGLVPSPHVYALALWGYQPNIPPSSSATTL